MERPRLTFRQAMQATAMNLVQIRATWRTWRAGYVAEQQRRQHELTTKGH